MATRALILRPGYFPLFDKGKPVANGYIYIGEPDLDPEIPANRKAITFLQEDGSEVAGPQPVRTSAGGVPTYNGSPVTVLIDGNYSVKVLDKHGAQVYYVPKNANLEDENIVTSVANITKFRALTSLVDGQVIYMTGHTSEDDGGGGEFVVVGDESGEIDNNGTLLVIDGKVVKRINYTKLTPEMFGVDGSASADDFDAWERFFDFHLSSGIPGVFRKRIYTFDPASNGVLRVGIDDGQSIDIDVNGAILQFSVLPDNAGAFYHMILFASGGIYSPAGATVERIHFKNAVLDGNLRNQPAPAGGSDYEQRAAVKVIIDASDGNRCKDVYFHNITQVDPMADTLQFGPSTAFDVDGEAAINNLTIDKFHAGTRNGVRAAIQIGSQCGRINISNVTRDKAQGSETNSIETEFSAIGVQTCTMNMVNVHIDDIELGCPAGKEEQFKINMTNVHTDGFFLCVGGSVKATNCTLGIALSNTQRMKSFECSNVEFRHSVYDDSGTQEVRRLSYTAVTGGCLWQFSNCKHVVDGALDPAANAPLFDTGNIANTEVDDHVFIFDGSWFDPAAPMSIDCYAGGTVETKGCTIGGFYRGVQCGAYSSFGSKWHSDGDDFRAVTGARFHIAGSPNSEIVFGSQVTDSLAFGSVANGQNIIKASGRKIDASAAPTGGGAVGDEVVLDAATYDAASSSAPVAWRCIRSHPSAAVWAVTANKP